MGVPALFRWLSVKYPKIVEAVVEEEPSSFDEEGVKVPVDYSQPNPNGFEVDNLYLDMNGIIHPCTHPEGRPAPPSEEAMMVEVFRYIDRIMGMIRPKRLLFLAIGNLVIAYFHIDGVAPRAKMNQQRSRRFRAAKEAAEKAEREADIRDDLRERGLLVDSISDEEEDDEAGEEPFDSNCITPGTPFMALVAASLRYYILSKLETADPLWRDLKIILSDASVPGEGEHKIVDYIRRQRLDPTHDPNLQHVIYGLDADLIMLSLATHEPRFRVLREDVFTEDRAGHCRRCGQAGHFADACPQAAAVQNAKKEVSRVDYSKDEADRPYGPLRKPFIFLNVAILREYLAAELRPQGDDRLPYKFDLERAIDDWIFLCFFVGNDFLPHLPSLEIREGAIDLLIDIYKANAEEMGGYICSGGDVNLARVEIMMRELGKVEETIFRKRQEKEDRRLENQRRYGTPTSSVASNQSNQAVAQALRNQQLAGTKRKAPEEETTAAPPEIPADQVRLWEPGAKGRYYRCKFHVDPDDQGFVQRVAKAYVEGLCWVMAYYFRGCPSWKWFYPFHYAPFASDCTNIATLKIRFEIGQPFRPFDQLMSVFPAASRQHIPEPFHPLMTDADSELAAYYPEDFEIDLNGKRHAWQGVALLPFIDEQHLLSVLDRHYHKLAEHHLAMNARGEHCLYLYGHGDLVSFKEWTPIKEELIKGLSGLIRHEDRLPSPGQSYPSPLESVGCPSLASLHSISLFYRLPFHDEDPDGQNLSYPTGLLPGVKLPPSPLTLDDKHQVASGAASKRFPGRLHLNGRGGFSGPPRRNFDRDYGRPDDYNDRRDERRDSPREGYQRHDYGRDERARDYGSDRRDQRDYGRDDRQAYGRDHGRDDRQANVDDRRHAHYSAPPPSTSQYQRYSTGNPFEALGYNPMRPSAAIYPPPASPGAYPPPAEGDDPFRPPPPPPAPRPPGGYSPWGGQSSRPSQSGGNLDQLYKRRK